MPFTTAIDVWIAGQAVATIAGMECKPKRRWLILEFVLLWIAAIWAVAFIATIVTQGTGFGNNWYQPFLALAGLAAATRYILRGVRNAWPIAILLTTLGTAVVLAIVFVWQR